MWKILFLNVRWRGSLVPTKLSVAVDGLWGVMRKGSEGIFLLGDFW